MTVRNRRIVVVTVRNNRRTRSMLTKFQERALVAISLAGGVQETRERTWVDSHGSKIVLLNPDERTWGCIGWPTITALTRARKITYDADKQRYVAGKLPTKPSSIKVNEVRS